MLTGSHEQGSPFRVRIFCMQAEFLFKIGSNFVQKARQYGIFGTCCLVSLFYVSSASRLLILQSFVFQQYIVGRLDLHPDRFLFDLAVLATYKCGRQVKRDYTLYWF